MPQLGPRAAYFRQAIRDRLLEHKEYIEEHGEDMPYITAWRWGDTDRAQRPPGRPPERAATAAAWRRRPKGTTCERMRVLLLNAGSSSLKCTRDGLRAMQRARARDRRTGPVRSRATNARAPDAQRVAEQVPFRGHGAAARHVLEDLAITPSARDGAPAERLGVVGHRIVHGGAFRIGGSRHRRGALAHRRTRGSGAAPQSPGSRDARHRGARVARGAAGRGVRHLVSLDAAAGRVHVSGAHAWTSEWGIRRYGFHGLSHAYCAVRAAAAARTHRRDLRLVICHLGHGCSATAVLDGRSVDTTMGFTPLDGLMMATRSGSLDPGILTHVQTKHGLSAQAVDDALNHRAGLLGVSGVSADMREVMAAADAGHAQARLAIDVYTHRVRQAIGALAVTMGGVDALVFTAGVGENSPPCVRQRAAGSSASASSSIRKRTRAAVPMPISREQDRAPASS